MEASGHLDDQMRECITNCSDCHDICLETAVSALHMDVGADHVTLLLDCAAICDTSRDFMLTGSRFHHRTCGVCAEVCEACAEACGSHDDALMQRCAEEISSGSQLVSTRPMIGICRRCASSCREMAGSGGESLH